MMKPLYRAFCWIAGVVAAVALEPESIAAQELALKSGNPKTVEIASLETVPSGPEVSSSMSWAATPAAAYAPIPIIAVTPSQHEGNKHSFWDRENRILFAATGSLATADFFVTHANLASGGRELNPLTRPFTGSTPALAANFAVETASVIGVSYFFHKTGHHRLERLTSVVNIGGSAGAVAYGLTHR